MGIGPIGAMNGYESYACRCIALEALSVNGPNVWTGDRLLLYTEVYTEPLVLPQYTPNILRTPYGECTRYYGFHEDLD